MNTVRSLSSIAVLIAVAVAFDPAAAQSLPSSLLPGGASSFQESYQDWNVACQVVNKAKRCTMAQQLTQQDGQRVLAVEIQSATAATAAGVLVLPFGLNLDGGVTLSIDDKPPQAALRFSTCLPVGCLVPLVFDTDVITALRTGEAVKITTLPDDGEPMTFSISLKGFATALDRIVTLGK